MNLWQKLRGLVLGPGDRGLLAGPGGCCCGGGGEGCDCNTNPECSSTFCRKAKGKYTTAPGGGLEILYDENLPGTPKCCGPVAKQKSRTRFTERWIGAGSNLCPGQVVLFRDIRVTIKGSSVVTETILRVAQPDCSLVETTSRVESFIPQGPCTGFDIAMIGPVTGGLSITNVSGTFRADCSSIEGYIDFTKADGTARVHQEWSAYLEPGNAACVDPTCRKACCLPNGHCIDGLTDTECLGLGGVPNDDGLPCYAAGCDTGLPTKGACCDTVTGDCLISTEAGCPPPRVFRGVGTLCGPTTCPPPTAACCLDGNCTETTQTGCAIIGGTWHPGSNCNSPAMCQSPGACCLALGCQDVANAAACASLGGVFQGPGTLCIGVACLGACCVPLVHGYTCTQETQGNCANLLGIWFPNTPCTPSPCPGGTGGGSGGFL